MVTRPWEVRTRRLASSRVLHPLQHFCDLGMWRTCSLFPRLSMQVPYSHTHGTQPSLGTQHLPRRPKLRKPDQRSQHQRRLLLRARRTTSTARHCRLRALLARTCHSRRTKPERRCSLPRHGARRGHDISHKADKPSPAMILAMVVQRIGIACDNGTLEDLLHHICRLTMYFHLHRIY